MAEEKEIQGFEGEMYESIQENPGAKTYGKEAEPLDPEQAGAVPDEKMRPGEESPPSS